MTIGKTGILEFGNNFKCNAALKLACYYKIKFGNNCRVGWDCLFMDSDFHSMKKLSGGHTKGYGEIFIGDYNWIGSKCVIMKHTKTPDYTTIAGTTIISKIMDNPEYSIIGTEKQISVLRTGLYRDVNDDKIEYEVM